MRERIGKIEGKKAIEEKAIEEKVIKEMREKQIEKNKEASKETFKVNKEINNNKLILIPKIEEYIEYMIGVIMKLPRIEKFNIGNEYKVCMYEMLENVMYLTKISEKRECLMHVNKIDVALNCQRIYLRIMKKNYWIDERKFNIAMDKIYEMGKIVGGLTKHYAKNN